MLTFILTVVGVGCLIVGGLIILLQFFVEGLEKVLERKIERSNNSGKKGGGLLWKILYFVVNIFDIHIFG